MSPLIGVGAGVGAGPSLDSVAPAGSAIRAFFDEAMTNNADLQDPTNYALTPLAGGDAVTVLGISTGPGTHPIYVDLSLSNPTTEGSSYELAVDPALKDVVGNTMDAGGLTLVFLGFGFSAVVPGELGIIEAMTGAIGEADAEIGGFRITRTTAVVAKGADLAGDYQWPGGSADLQVVLVNDTSDVVAGDWIGFRTDNQMWEIDVIVPNTSVSLLNPNGLTYPTDAGIGTSFKAVTTIPVETTHGWSSTGKIALDGVPYSYAGITATSFTGVSHVAGGATVIGSAMVHRDETIVADITREWSALDLIRRNMLVNHAEDKYLSNLGRNLAVPRIPLFESDDQYRDVIKALAYNPRGTMFGLELAMDALVGAGNYELYEDLTNFPNTVFVRLTAGYMGTESVGKAFLTGPEWDELAGAQDTLALSATPNAIAGVQLYDLEKLFDFRDDIPSDVELVPWAGEAPITPWEYAGGEAEGVAVTNVPGQYTEFVSTTGTVYYLMSAVEGARLTDKSQAEASVLLNIPVAAVMSGVNRAQCALLLRDGVRSVRWGVLDVDPANYRVGLYDAAGWLGTTAVVSKDAFHEITLIKNGDVDAELWVDGVLIQREAYSNFVVTVIHRASFGILITTAGLILRYKQIGTKWSTITDYWNARGLVGTVAAANPAQFNANTGGTIFIAGDVGKRLQLSGSAITNPDGGNNNGIWEIESLVGGPPSDVAELVGEDRTGASVPDFAGHPTRITVPDDPEAFTFPDDLGKEIVIEGSSLGNDGTYVIEKLLESWGANIDLASYDTPFTVKTNYCEVKVAPGLTATESGLDYHLVPVFANEAAALDWELSDAGAFAGTTITLRQGLWANGLIMEMRFSDVLTAQLMAASVVMNAVIQESPLLYEVYPFYLADPLGLVRAYLDAITAAGVIPDFGISS